MRSDNSIYTDYKFNFGMIFAVLRYGKTTDNNRQRDGRRTYKDVTQVYICHEAENKNVAGDSKWYNFHSGTGV